jgi:hypothetical protein
MFLLPISLFSLSFGLSFDAYSDLKPQHCCMLEPIFSFFFPGVGSGFVSILFISPLHSLFLVFCILLLLSHLGVIIFAACFTTVVSDIFVTFFYHLVIILRPLK